MKRCVTIGAIAGLSIGVLIFLGYVIASWWVCSTLLDCPGHWLPYLLVFAIGATITTLLGATAAFLLRGLYEFTRVDEPSP